jgi:L-threonylcarbamoyladenylate synthase
LKILAPVRESIERAADALRSGQLIGLPTETVYGIGADASNPNAVLKTFQLKRRPAENPLIVHVNNLEAAERLVRELPETAIHLAERFWPGPLTLVLKKNDVIAPIVTGGLDTVAIRVPRHGVALEILKAAKLPVSAPSANAFMGLSPTRAEHIAPEILEGLACVIEGGPCDVGVESTVVDCTEETPTILRPGGITRAQIESVLGNATSRRMLTEHRSPGMYLRHYSPRTSVRLVEKLGADDAGITFEAPKHSAQRQLPLDSVIYAQELYATLYELDQLGRTELLIQMPPETEDWEAVWDRIEKSAGP